ncbi:MAG: transcription-repair coupling factor [Candidatus Coatesbacteria bacterium]|nr:transcription-repair coupling factor [Candidatus Coatesbacteria bacterium]
MDEEKLLKNKSAFLMEVESYITEILPEKLPSNFCSIAGSSDIFLLSHIFRKSKDNVFVVTKDELEADRIYLEYKSLYGDMELAIFPSWDILPYEDASPSKSVIKERLETMHRLLRAEKSMIIISVEALMQVTIPPDILLENLVEIRKDQETEPQKFINILISKGYIRTFLVQNPGECSLKGDVLDVFPFGHRLPKRIEFFDNKVESIRAFSPSTQRSIEKHDEVIFLPVEEAILTEEHHGRIQENELFERRFEFYLPLLYNQSSFIFDYLNSNCTIILHSKFDLQRRADRKIKQAIERYELEGISRKMCKPEEIFLTFEKIEEKLKTMKISPIIIEPLLDLEDGFNLGFLEPGSLYLNFEEFQQKAFKEQEAGKRIFITGHTLTQLRRLNSLLSDGLEASYFQSGLDRGFEIKGRNILLFADSDITQKTSRKRHRIGWDGISEVIESLPDIALLNDGDYIVHFDFGIGYYRGMSSVKTSLQSIDCIIIEYAKGDKIYVPVDQLDKVFKYIGGEASIDRIGSTRWPKAKQKAYEATREIAEELLNIYAARKANPGFNYTPDSQLMHVLESRFPFIETEDQIQAIHEVKKDMEMAEPMDRLICGDVGFGKTEVALRAAFKAALDGKQVAILAPTTILTEQHYNTFYKRLEGMPIKVESISRFKTSREQKLILNSLKKGEIDIIIGTHRLLSEDVEFRDLGLVIIDEEQKFGVVHKERLKKFRLEVDVLTLTATPIPRTLYMSIMGAKDISKINTPPIGRQSIDTRIVAFKDDIIKNAIYREVERGGQVFFVHNRVQTILSVSNKVKELVPDLSIAVAHGQMRSQQLEKVMSDFSEGFYDVLVSTMIIESGLDMPNVNTIIINQADRFGLSQLYQLRGRVGRSKRKAYAYFIVSHKDKLTDIANKRLQAIKKYYDLGSGFNIAMKDLEIRGTGDILGAKQSGHIAAIGYELYCKMLKESIEEMKTNKPFVASKETKINANFSAYFPSDYIEDENERLKLYRNLALSLKIEEIDTIEDEIRDRFGRIPKPSQNLILLSRIKLLANKLEIEEIKLSTERACIYISMEDAPKGQDLSKFIQSAPVIIEFRQEHGRFLLNFKDPFPLKTTVKVLSELLKLKGQLAK